jgi:transposase-like protein
MDENKLKALAAELAPQINKSWRAHWENLDTYFSYLPNIRKDIYTADAIESLNSVIRQAIKKRKVFPTVDPVGRLFIWRSGGPKKMKYADRGQAAGNKPLYYRVR